MVNLGPMEVLALLVLVLIWLVPAYLVARFAEGRGQSFGLFLVVGRATSFVVSLVLALIMGEHRGSHGRSAHTGAH